MPRTFANKKITAKNCRQMDYILHIDTSGDMGTIALSANGKVLAERINTDTRNHAAVINTFINEVIAEGGIKLKDIGAVAVCGGPGSYTGLRIGLSTAKALCYTLDIPLLHHDRLLLLALPECYNELSIYNNIGSILQAREKEYYFGLYSKDFQNIYGPKHIFEHELEEIFDEYGKNTIVVGKINDEAEIAQFFTSLYREVHKIDLNYWSVYAYKSYVEKKFANLSLAEPFYLKQVYTHK